ncbi:class I SAM-dependent methyltransferase [Ruegeria sediminis]|uniref:Class I SAM-dependent methyltransferase n=1 Tax=Ruegeria sediminis TaxID=2583820 RepID=A0ABY2WSQ9_9RHOB|nr:class I SAM-dependent methyltransferase [Ruegeria sediminis]TMV03740.1 class I SAM-dependent methyltransferase [Ruegeria sediminis]
MPQSPLTGKSGRFLFEHKVMNRHLARYYLDESCGYIWVDAPHWLDEAYSDAIAMTDTGILARNFANIGIVSTAMRANGMEKARGIDIGAGYGLLVRGLRDLGIDFHWSDPYAENLFARGFEADGGKYRVAAAFEVLEHLPDPLAHLKEARDRFGFETIFFSATCFDPEDIPGTDWWYWAFETGQHIGFFSQQCLDFIAAQLGMRMVALRADVYAFTTRKDLVWPNGWERWKLDRKFRKASLAEQDYQAMKRRVSGAERRD